MLATVVPLFAIFVIIKADFKGYGVPVDDYFEDGDLNIAALLPLFTTSVPKCTGARPDWMVEAAAAVRYMTTKINQDKNILPNTTMGFVLLNDCSEPSVAVGKAAQLIPVASCSTSKNTSHFIHRSYDVVGLVGLTSSSKSTKVSSLLSHFKVPHISFRATSDELSDKVSYEYFTRTIPPDMYETQAMAELVLNFNWTYVSTISVEGSYGRDGINKIISLLELKGVCIAYSKIIEPNSAESIYDGIIQDLRLNKNAKVVIVMLYEQLFKKLMLALHRANGTGEFIFVTSDAFFPATWAGNEQKFVGVFSTVPAETLSKEFAKWYSTQSAIQRPGESVWEGHRRPQDLGCEWHAVDHELSCAKYASLSVTELPGFYWSPTPTMVMDAMQTFFVALHALIQKECPSAFGHREQLRTCITGETLLKHIRNVSFQGLIQYIQFDENGDLIGGYDYRYFQKSMTGGYSNAKVGKWDRVSGVVMKEDLIIWYKKDTHVIDISYEVPESVCSKPCDIGEYSIQGELACCWVCKTCRENEKLNNDKTGCETCPELYWPDQVRFDTCLPIVPNYMLWTDHLAIVLELLSAFGIFFSFYIIRILIKYQDRKVIKGSSIELMAFILTGVIMSYLTVFAYLIKPEDWTCFVTYFCFHVSCTFMFAPLVLKTIRIYRIFAAAEKLTHGVPMVNTSSQVFLCVFHIVTQVRIISFLSSKYIII